MTAEVRKAKAETCGPKAYTERGSSHLSRPWLRIFFFSRQHLFSAGWFCYVFFFVNFNFKDNFGKSTPPRHIWPIWKNVILSAVLLFYLFVYILRALYIWIRMLINCSYMTISLSLFSFIEPILSIEELLPNIPAGIQVIVCLWLYWASSVCSCPCCGYCSNL